MTTRRASVAWALGLAALGCSGRSLLSPPDAGNADAAGPTCTRLSIAECARTNGCVVLSASLVNDPTEETLTCALPSTPAGCGPATCAPGQTLALGTYGETWVVLSTCLPDGWTATSVDAGVSTCTPCDQLPLTDCGGTPYCRVIQGGRVDEKRSCYGTFETVGCQYQSEGCGALQTAAIDPDGNPWVFPSTCLPRGWTATSSSGPVTMCPMPDAGADAADAGGAGDAMDAAIESAPVDAGVDTSDAPVDNPHADAGDAPVDNSVVEAGVDLAIDHSIDQSPDHD